MSTKYRVDLFELIVNDGEVVGNEIHTYFTEFDPFSKEFETELFDMIEELIENPLDADTANVYDSNGNFLYAYSGLWENYDEAED